MCLSRARLEIGKRKRIPSFWGVTSAERRVGSVHARVCSVQYTAHLLDCPTPLHLPALLSYNYTFYRQPTNKVSPFFCSTTSNHLDFRSSSKKRIRGHSSMRTSNHLIGLLNFLTFLLSIPILAGGIWLSTQANSTECLRFLQWPLIVIGVSIMVVSLAGFAGACYRNTFLMWLYLFVMFFVIVALIAFIVFAYAVTDKGAGRTVPSRTYLDYFLEDYSGWLKDRVADDGYWVKISSCIRDSKVCNKMGRTVGGVPETVEMFSLRRLSPIEVLFSLYVVLEIGDLFSPVC